MIKRVISRYQWYWLQSGSCDTEDWRNDAENSALIKGINNNFKYIQIENILICNDISQYYSVHCISDQMNAASVSRRDVLKTWNDLSLLKGSVYV